MLVLSRKPGERIHIGSDIVITVLDISGKLVRVGVEAPKKITILRSELYEQVESENRLAASKSGYFKKLKDISTLIGHAKKKS